MLDNETLNDLDHQYLWHPFTQMKDWISKESIFIEQGEGVWLIDTKGKRYIDGVSSIWANVHGHNKKELNEAIHEQLKKISHSTLLGLSNIPSTLLAQKLIQLAPKGLGKVFYSDNGSTAMEVGLKIAYQYLQQTNQKKKIRFVTLKQSYHGDTIGGVSLGGIASYNKIFSALLFEVIRVENPYYYRSSFIDEKECEDFCIENFQLVLEKNEGKVGAFFLESYVQGAGGMIVYPKDFMKRVQKLCIDYGVLFILDEVATGFGKTGNLFACEEDHLEPDIMALGKGISGGYLPLAATLTTNKIYEGFLGNHEESKTFFHGHTYTGNPLACCCGLASLRIFEKEKVLEAVSLKIKFLGEGLKRFWKLEHIGDIRQKGMMVGLELVESRWDKKSYSPKLKMGHKVCMEARNHSILIRPLGDIIIIMPPLSIQIKELDQLLQGIYESILKVTHNLAK